MSSGAAVSGTPAHMSICLATTSELQTTPLRGAALVCMPRYVRESRTKSLNETDKFATGGVALQSSHLVGLPTPLNDFSLGANSIQRGRDGNVNVRRGGEQ